MSPLLGETTYSNTQRGTPSQRKIQRLRQKHDHLNITYKIPERGQLNTSHVGTTQLILCRISKLLPSSYLQKTKKNKALTAHTDSRAYFTWRVGIPYTFADPAQSHKRHQNHKYYSLYKRYPPPKFHMKLHAEVDIQVIQLNTNEKMRVVCKNRYNTSKPPIQKRITSRIRNHCDIK